MRAAKDGGAGEVIDGLERTRAKLIELTPQRLSSSRKTL